MTDTQKKSRAEQQKLNDECMNKCQLSCPEKPKEETSILLIIFVCVVIFAVVMFLGWITEGEIFRILEIFIALPT